MKAENQILILAKGSAKSAKGAKSYRDLTGQSQKGEILGIR